MSVSAVAVRFLVVALTALVLAGCKPVVVPEDAGAAPAGHRFDNVEAAIFPHVPAQMPDAALEADGRLAPWAMQVQVGAALHALSEACSIEGVAMARDVLGAQREAMQAGVDAGRFDAVWIWAYRQARQKISAQPRQALEAGCMQLRGMEPGIVLPEASAG